jgi:HSP20 family protein
MSLKDLVTRKSTDVAHEERNPFNALQTRMNQLFDDFGKGLSWPSLWGRDFDSQIGAFMPNVEVSENDKSVTVSAEIPGMAEKDIELRLSDDNQLLMLRGEKKLVTEKKEDNYVRTERSYGSFRRMIPLPTAVMEDGIEATCKDGVLVVKMAKAPEEKAGSRKIPIKQV